jgi:acyl-CoA synthetase (AMP-forming)/AMP-acid ligase II
MPPPPNDPGSLRASSTATGAASGRFLYAVQANVALDDLVRGSSLSVGHDRLAGRSVLLAAKDQLAAALALIELDGVVQRLVVCPSDLPSEHIPSIVRAAAVDAVLSDRAVPDAGLPARTEFVCCGARIAPVRQQRGADRRTEWVLLTSGTTGVPKLVLHTLSTLAGALRTGDAAGNGRVWGTFYDIRRYGGLQIFLRAVLGGGSLVLSSAEEPTAEFLARAGACGVTHISGTPSHWRRALMSRTARRIAPHYVRLSGEIADQAILDRLRSAYPSARIGHAFASTEAGVGFEVNDGLSGFPASLLGGRANDVEIKVSDGSLRLRSGRTALRYLGGDSGPVADAEGFVDTGDMVERRGDRYHFVGRKGGIVNVGGCKVYPEEVEAVINRHPGVEMSLVKARHSPITGAIVVADVIAAGLESNAGSDGGDTEALNEGILDLCRRALAPYKVPAVIRFVSSLDITAAGKLVRRDA